MSYIDARHALPPELHSSSARLCPVSCQATGHGSGQSLRTTSVRRCGLTLPIYRNPQVRDSAHVNSSVLLHAFFLLSFLNVQCMPYASCVPASRCVGFPVKGRH